MTQDNQISIYLAGLQKLVELWNGNKHLPANYLFSQTWKIILKNEATFAGPFKRNRFNIPWHNFVFVDIATNLKALRSDFSPELRLQFPGQEPDALSSSIFVTLHTDLEYCIVAALQKNGSKCTILSATDEKNTPKFYDGTSGMRHIARDANCLLLARTELLEGRNLIVPVDYTLYDAKAKTFLRKIGMATFDFARKCKFKLFYILPVVGSDGAIILYLKAAGLNKSPTDCADEFLEFCASHSPNRIGLVRDNWFSDTQGKKNSVISK